MLALVQCDFQPVCAASSPHQQPSPPLIHGGCALIDNDRRDPVVPRMPAPERNSPQIRNAANQYAAPIAIVPVVEDLHPRMAKDLNGRNVISKSARQCRKPVARPDTEVMPPKRRRRVEARPIPRIRTVVPCRIPAAALWPVRPIIIWRQSPPMIASLPVSCTCKPK